MSDAEAALSTLGALQRARRPPRGRRLRHRLLVARVPRATPGRVPQDRPFVRRAASACDPTAPPSSAQSSAWRGRSAHDRGRGRRDRRPAPAACRACAATSRRATCSARHGRRTSTATTLHGHPRRGSWGQPATQPAEPMRLPGRACQLSRAGRTRSSRRILIVVLVVLAIIALLVYIFGRRPDVRVGTLDRFATFGYSLHQTCSDGSSRSSPRRPGRETAGAAGTDRGGSPWRRR